MKNPGRPLRHGLNHANKGIARAHPQRHPKPRPLTKMVPNSFCCTFHMREGVVAAAQVPVVLLLAIGRARVTVGHAGPVRQKSAGLARLRMVCHDAQGEGVEQGVGPGTVQLFMGPGAVRLRPSVHWKFILRGRGGTPSGPWEEAGAQPQQGDQSPGRGQTGRQQERAPEGPSLKHARCRACVRMRRGTGTWRAESTDYFSRGHSELRQLGGFSGVGAIAPSFVPAECSGGRGTWGIFGKPLKSAIRNTQVCMLYWRYV